MKSEKSSQQLYKNITTDYAVCAVIIVVKLTDQYQKYLEILTRDGLCQNSLPSL